MAPTHMISCEQKLGLFYVVKTAFGFMSSSSLVLTPVQE